MEEIIFDNFFFIFRKDIGFGKIVAFLSHLPIGKVVGMIRMKIVERSISMVYGMTFFVIGQIGTNLCAKY